MFDKYNLIITTVFFSDFIVNLPNSYQVLPFHIPDFIIFSVKKDVILKNFIVFEGLDGAGTTTQAKILAENLKKGDAETAFTNAIKKCGQLMAENFPNHEENPNELADGLVVLEDTEWY